jgi:hypothetical protein
METETAIYEPPRDDLPFLVVTIKSDGGMEVLRAETQTEARIMVSKEARRRKKQKSAI